MLTGISLKNFKTWKSTGQIDLAPITVFFGVNSSGKSSIGQFLLMLRRTVEQPDRNLVFLTNDDANQDLGAYEDYVHNGNTSLDISFDIQWRNPEEVKLSKSLLGGYDEPILWLGFYGRVGLSADFPRIVSSKLLRYGLIPRDGHQFAWVSMNRVGEGSEDYKMDFRTLKLRRRKGQPGSLNAPTKFYGFPDELYNYYQNAEPLKDLQFEFERVLKGIHYLGPIRQYPKREYLWPGQSPVDVGFQGENTMAALLAGQERKVRLGSNEEASPLQGVVGRWLERLGVVEDFRVVNPQKSGRHYQIRLKMNGRKEEVNLIDVGFGVSQVLPVVTEAFYAEPNSTVIIEQPELHLHPAVQSELADLFIEAISSQADGMNRNVQFLIESHSEHFLRRFQRRVAEGQLKASDIMIYYCEPSTTGEGSTIRQLLLDDLGILRDWPQNFFGDQMTDIVEMRKAQILRHPNGTINGTNGGPHK